MTDTSSRIAGPAPYVGNTFNPIGKTDLLPGTPVRSTGAAPEEGEVRRAHADNVANVYCVGLVQSNSAIEKPVHVQYAGVLDLPTAEWDAITGDLGGLDSNKPYYLGAAMPGKLTKVKPSSEGTFALKVGVALTTTSFLIQIGEPVSNG
jgi:hypothetical protein